MIKELVNMCKDLDFDREKALNIIKSIDVNEEFIADKYNNKTILLEKAAESANVSMVELLLENGADPDKIFNYCESVLWKLQYNDGETDEENERRLIIAQRLLEYGANPLIIPENGGEDLFEFVRFTVFNDSHNELWKYRSRFFILLVAFGGKKYYCEPEIFEDFDKSNMKQYSFYMVPTDSGRYFGVICDENDNDIAFI